MSIIKVVGVTKITTGGISVFDIVGCGPDENFVLESGVIAHNSRARSALRLVGMHGTPAEKARVRSAVKAKWGIGGNVQESWQDIKTAAAGFLGRHHDKIMKAQQFLADNFATGTVPGVEDAAATVASGALPKVFDVNNMKDRFGRVRKAKRIAMERQLQTQRLRNKVANARIARVKSGIHEPAAPSMRNQESAHMSMKRVLLEALVSPLRAMPEQAMQALEHPAKKLKKPSALTKKRQPPMPKDNYYSSDQ